MVVDHLCLFLDGPGELRWTVGRVAAPLFFVLAGHLAHRLSGRLLLLIVLGGVVTPPTVRDLVLPTIGLGCVLVVLARRRGWLPGLAFGLVVLTLAVPVWLPGTWLMPASLLACVLGALLPREVLRGWGRRLPHALVWAGRWPLTVYLGHLWLLEVLTS